MQVQAILFDWGGTLAQVVTQHDRLTRGAREAAGILAGAGGNEACVADFIARILGAEELAAADPELHEADVHRYLREWAAGICPDTQRLAEAADALGRAWMGSLELFDGVLEALGALRQRGLILGIVSNCMVPPPWCHDELVRIGLAPFFDFAVFSSEVGYRKPSRIIYERALQELRKRTAIEDLSRVLFVGDSPAFDVIAPAALGMKTALVACRKGIWPAADYERARPDLRVHSVAELPALLFPTPR